MIGSQIKYLLLLVFCYTYTCINATPLIGTTSLLYGESDAISVVRGKLANPKDSAAKLNIRPVGLAEIAKQMPGFQAMLNTALDESKTFSVYDATSVLQSWRTTNPKLLENFYESPQMQLPAESNGSKTTTASVVKTAPNQHKFVLLGWVESLNETETRTPVSGADKVVLMYNLGIRCEYRLINLENKQVVAIFTATGHGGIARILSINAPFSYEMQPIVSNLLHSLAGDVRHFLLVHENEYTKKYNNATKVDPPKPQLTK